MPDPCETYTCTIRDGLLARITELEQLTEQQAAVAAEYDAARRELWRQAETARVAMAVLEREAATREAAIRAEERERACAILASAEPNTRADALLGQLSADAVLTRLPHDVAGLLADWCEATADDLAEAQALIRGLE